MNNTIESLNRLAVVFGYADISEPEEPPLLQSSPLPLAHALLKMEEARQRFGKEPVLWDGGGKTRLVVVPIGPVALTEKIDEYCERRGEAADLARELRVSEATVSYWRRGQRRPSFALELALRYILGLPLFEGIENPAKPRIPSKREEMLKYLYRYQSDSFEPRQRTIARLEKSGQLPPKGPDDPE